MAEPYWLLTWLGSKKITTRAEAGAALRRPSAMRELRLVAEQWSQSAAAPQPALNLVAGLGLKIYDHLSCPTPACRRRQVDVLFRHAWHYFDTILLPDGAGTLLLNPPEGLGEEELLSEILGMVETALHIQDLGADELVQYYPTIHGALGHAEASPLGQPARWDAACKEVENSILTEASFTVKEIGHRAFSIRIDPPASEIAPEFRIWLDKDAPEDKDLLISHFAHQLASEYMSALENDLKVAHLLKGPLGSTLWSHQRAISAMSEAPDPASVALHVAFPTLENVPINELIAIRSANQDAFISFRNAIARAAKEMSANNPTLNYKELSNRITLDVIEPELANLNKRLRSAKRSLTRKAAATIVLSSVGTLCAASLGLFPAAAIGTLGAAAALSNLGKDVSKYFDENREIELSDMYFIWKALNHAE